MGLDERMEAFRSRLAVEDQRNRSSNMLVWHWIVGWKLTLQITFWSWAERTRLFRWLADTGRLKPKYLAKTWKRSQQRARHARLIQALQWRLDRIDAERRSRLG